ncbi:hypothetical protein NW755_006884 [Fusarium falciforme]|uniref:Uncharacterized protein n=1 Tax=Fusarium falciforme TaxID=195108 RepID=A0A9W8UZH8_9HYPO|nr:hypothetical protein NW755_006884 [Fusarium falciforme]
MRQFQVVEVVYRTGGEEEVFQNRKVFEVRARLDDPAQIMSVDTSPSNTERLQTRKARFLEATYATTREGFEIRRHSRKVSRFETRLKNPKRQLGDTEGTHCRRWHIGHPNTDTESGRGCAEGEVLEIGEQGK